ncbi:unnamed protein product [Closterium sp. NIES-64]|nr:unnamed protein product [Closterium sp. NIES-64]
MGGRLEREVAAWVDGPCRARGAEASCVGERQNTNMESGGDGRLEREVAAWAEGACRARGEGEWKVVMVCEDTGSGIPPEEMRWVLDPYGGDPHHSTRSPAAADADAAGAAGGIDGAAAVGGPDAAAGGRGDSKKQRRIMPSISLSLLSLPLSLFPRAYPAGRTAAKEGQQSHASLSNSFLTLPLSHLPPAFCVLVLRCAYTAAKEGQQSHPSHARREGCCSPRLDALPCPLPPLHLPCGGDAGKHGSAVRQCHQHHHPSGPTPLCTAPPNQTWGQQQQALGGREGQSRGVQQHWMQGPRGHSWSSSLHSVLLSPVAPLSPIAPLSPLNPLSPAAPLSPVSLRLQAMPELSPHLGAGGFGSSLGGSSMGVVGGVVGGGLGGGAGGVEAAVRAAVAGRRVAVVDDNAVNRMVARRTLQGYGADVLLLASGEDTLQAVSSHMDPSPHPPSSCLQLLLLDLHMPPGIDG